MVNGSPRRKKTRIRKAAPTVREKIESGAKAEKPKPARRARPLAIASTPLRMLWRVVGPVLRPLSPIGRLLARVLGRLVPVYFINAWRELRLVTWPNRRETWRLTGAVIVFAVVFGSLVWVVDLGLDQLFKRFVLR